MIDVVLHDAVVEQDVVIDPRAAFAVARVVGWLEQLLFRKTGDGVDEGAVRFLERVEGLTNASAVGDGGGSGESLLRSDHRPEHH